MPKAIDHEKHVDATVGNYITVLCVLIALVLLNTGLAFAPIGRFHAVFAVGLAVAEALIVILFFMHIWWSSKLMKLTVAAGFFTFLVLIVMTLCDYTSRAWGLW